MGSKKGRKAVETADLMIQPPVAELKKSSKKEKSKSEIDDIFGEKKRKKRENEKGEGVQAAEKKRESSEVVKLNAKGEIVKPKKAKSGKTASGKSTPAAPTSRKKTEDGFTVYSAEELGFNKKGAGGTPLCPFDCDCCF